MPFDPDSPAAPGDLAGPDGIDDWFVPRQAANQIDYPNDWFVPGSTQTVAPHPNDWIYPDGRNAPMPATAQAAPRPQLAANSAISNRAAPPPDPLAAYWSLIPASRAGAMAWHPPIFLSPNPFSPENIPASAWVTPPPIFPSSFGQFSSTANSPRDLPPDVGLNGLLGGIGKMLADRARADDPWHAAANGPLGGIAKLISALAPGSVAAAGTGYGLLGASANLRPAASNASADASYAADSRPFLSPDPVGFGDGDPLPDIELVADKKSGQRDRDIFIERAFGTTPPFGSTAPKLVPPIVGRPPPLPPTPLVAPTQPPSSPGGLPSPSPGQSANSARPSGTPIGPAPAVTPVEQPEGGDGTSGPNGEFGGSVVPIITKPYSRPPNATIRRQRVSVQGQPCVTCGVVHPKMYANHIEPLVQQYYRTGTIDTAQMQSLNAVNAQCPTCSARQGGFMANFSKFMKDLLGL
jgi:hypothetical protein